MFHPPEKIIMNTIDKNTLNRCREGFQKQKITDTIGTYADFFIKKIQFHLFVQADFKQKSQLQIVPMMNFEKNTIFARAYHQ